MGGWSRTAKYPGAAQLPGVVVFRWEAPLFFANSGTVAADRVRDLVHRYGLSTTLDREHFYPSLAQALDAINNAAVDSPMPPDEGMPPP